MIGKTRVDPISLRLNIYTQNDSIYGDIILSVNDIVDEKFIDMGWCYKPLSDTSSDIRFDCLDVRFYFSLAEINDESKPGYSNKYIGYDLFSPELDSTHMLPIDMVTGFLDSNIDSEATDKSGSWDINTTKSYKQCVNGTSNCLFSASFSHTFSGSDV